MMQIRYNFLVSVFVGSYLYLILFTVYLLWLSSRHLIQIHNSRLQRSKLLIEELVLLVHFEIKLFFIFKCFEMVKS